MEERDYREEYINFRNFGVSEKVLGLSHLKKGHQKIDEEQKNFITRIDNSAGPMILKTWVERAIVQDAQHLLIIIFTFFANLAIWSCTTIY